MPCSIGHWRMPLSLRCDGCISSCPSFMKSGLHHVWLRTVSFHDDALRHGRSLQWARSPGAIAGTHQPGLDGILQ